VTCANPLVDTDFWVLPITRTFVSEMSATHNRSLTRASSKRASDNRLIAQNALTSQCFHCDADLVILARDPPDQCGCSVELTRNLGYLPVACWAIPAELGVSARNCVPELVPLMCPLSQGLADCLPWPG
jgi:hypothetical protein